MKTVLLKLLFLFICFTSIAQKKPALNKNFALIYDSLDLQKIIPQVDSLNSSFYLKKPIKHYAIKQARANYIFLHGFNRKALDDIKHHMPFEQFVIKYPKTAFIKDVLVTQQIEKPDHETPIMRFSMIDPLNDRNSSVYHHNLKTLPTNYRNKTVYYYEDSFLDEYSGIYAFHFLEDFSSSEIPEPYSQMMDYKETIFDSSAPVYFPNALWYNDQWYKVQSLGPQNVVDSFLVGMYGSWRNDVSDEELALTKNMLASSDSLKTFFKRAIDFATKNHFSNETFEYVVGKLAPLEKTLNIQRGRMPGRSCGNDPAPLMHDYAIACNALKNGDLKLFLNAHQLVASDCVPMEVGAFKKFPVSRHAYVNELEFIHLDMGKYFIGSYLSLDKNNCFGNFDRYEAFKYFELYYFKEKDKIEDILLQGISDIKLDNYNRLFLAQIFAAYLSR
ncbi:MAG: hypothetical protein ABI402_11475 [Ferruginibacter sp.]